MDMHMARARPSNGCAQRSNAPSVEQRLSSPRPSPRGPTAVFWALPHAHGTAGAGGSR